jgi:hypothetical protein
MITTGRKPCMWIVSASAVNLVIGRRKSQHDISKRLGNEKLCYHVRPV